MVTGWTSIYEFIHQRDRLVPLGHSAVILLELFKRDYIAPHLEDDVGYLLVEFHPHLLIGFISSMWPVYTLAFNDFCRPEHLRLIQYASVCLQL